MEVEEAESDSTLREKVWWTLFLILVVLCIVSVVLFIVMGVDKALHFFFAVP